ncbi:MAG: prepilin-type N-terminal cleavage/methylation domain-containing protein [Nitrospinae bacterium]|nr:prepilin-type N-terminal cleavage/methylation domain-containing protein [Nitrospinota bacterium]
MRRGGRRNGGGFTLLEVVIALAILSISLVTLLSAHGRAVTISANAEALTDAVTLAREEMEKLNVAAMPVEERSEKLKRDDYPEYEWRTDIKETPFTNVWEARLVVFKTGDKEERPVFNLVSYLSR